MIQNIKQKKLILKSIKIILNMLPIKNILFFKDEIVILINSKFLIVILTFLKLHTHSQYNLLVCISGVDYLYKKYRFELNYELLSMRFNNRIRIKLFFDELTSIPSIDKLFSSASWYECEIWDMFGIFFSNHSNLKRILTDYGFEGNPLKKDFPLSGYIEIKYNEAQKRIISESIELSQEYRTFNFLSPWET